MYLTCDGCDGYGTTGRMITCGAVGAHVQGTCLTCGGSGKVVEGWVARFNRTRVEAFEEAFEERHGRKLTEGELKYLGLEKR
jgi:hypothetical protein